MSNVVVYNPEQIQLLKDTVCKGATNEEFKLFLYVAEKTGLDPLTKQIYAVKRWNKKLNREEMTCQTGIDGFRVIAQRSGFYQGQVGPFWCGDDGQWVDVWLKKELPRAAKIGVYRTEFIEPLYAVANFDAYKQTTKDGNLTQFWEKMPELMIAKVAESLALRKAFPQDLSGLYIPEEISINEEKEAKGNVAYNPMGIGPGEIAVGGKISLEDAKKLVERINQHDSSMVTTNLHDNNVPEKPSIPEDQTPLNDPGEYKFTFGANEGKKLKDMLLPSIKGWIEWADKQPNKKGHILDALKNCNEYIKSKV